MSPDPRPPSDDPGSGDSASPDAGDPPSPPDGPRITRDPVALVAGTLVGLAGLLFLLEPVAGPVAVGGARLRPVVLSGIALAAGLTVGGVGYLARGRRRVGIGHAGSAAGWILVVVATAVGSGPLLWAGAVLIAGTGLYLVAQSRDLVG